MSKAPHHELIPLLDKHGISWDAFSKRGRPPTGIREKRSAIISELHMAGTPWSRMIEVTGLSNGSIQRLTKVMWNDSSRKNRQESAARVGHSRKGETKVWLSNQLHQAWAQGKYDFHRGRVHPPDERARQRAGYTPLVRARMSLKKVFFLLEHPGWSRGRGRYVTSIKCKGRGTFWVRSSYEAAAVKRLDLDPQVVHYEYELPCEEINGKFILPDFVVTHVDGQCVLVEVKASWVWGMEKNHPVHIRLRRSEVVASSRGWGFEVWTEKELANALV